MKIAFVFAAIAVGTFGISSAVAQGEALETKGVVTATRDAKTNKVKIVLTGADAKVYVNKDYSMKCTLTIASGGTLGKAELKKEDAVFVDAAGKTGKATSATFSTGADKAVSGECKFVVCTDTACSSPFKKTFTTT